MDLRRSNWIEDFKHLPSNYLSPTSVTMTLTATDAAGAERAAVALIAYAYASPLCGVGSPVCNVAALDGVIDGKDAHIGKAGGGGGTPNWTYYAGGIVIEGWNDLFPNAGATSKVLDLQRFPLTGSINDNQKDYGLNPTASTHSDQAVAKRVKLAGNPYTIHLYMADMGDPSGYANWNGINSDGPAVQGTPTAGTGWYSIVGGDPQVSVFLCNSPVSLSFSVVNASAWISLRSVDFEVPAHSRPWTFPGAEIWVDFMDMKGNVVDSLDPTIYGLFQDPGRATIPPCLNPPIPNSPVCYYQNPDGSYPGGVMPGNWGYTPFDVDNKNCPGQHEHQFLTERTLTQLPYAKVQRSRAPRTGNTMQAVSSLRDGMTSSQTREAAE
jgi:hypothetical protein